ncbi:UNVERIFIED_CONTAM: hypothetical protein DES50_10174 [Williamsia faeni]
MTTQVDPEDLREAARQIGGGTTGTTPFGGVSPGTATSSLRFAGTGMSATDTATALTTAADAAETAVEVVRARISEWNSILTESAETFETTEEVSTRRLEALGDFNTRPQG